MNGESALLRFDLLEANHIGLGAPKPGQKIVQPFVHPVDVESCDLHRSVFLAESVPGIGDRKRSIPGRRDLDPLERVRRVEIRYEVVRWC